LTLQDCELTEFIEIAARSGYNYVSLRLAKVCAGERIAPLVSDAALRRRTARLVGDAGLRVLDVELVRLDSAARPEDFLPLLGAAAELGARAVIVQLPDPDRQRATDHYAAICDLAAQHRLCAVLEFVSWTETPDLRSAATVIRSAGRPNGGILVDMLHFDRSGSHLNELEKLPPEWFHFVHLCDALRARPTVTEGIIRTARGQRLFPGMGEINIREILRRIPEVPCSLEIPNTELMNRLGPETYARQALEAAKNYLAVEMA